MMKKTNRKETLKIWLGALLLFFATMAEAVGTGCKKLRTLPKKVMAVCVAAALIVAMVPVAVFAAATSYDIWVEGVEVTSENKDNVLGKNGFQGGASVRYDPATSTLTLNYAALKSVNTVPKTYGAYCAIYIGANAPADVTVILKGVNSIVAESSDKSAYGIYCYSTKNLTIKNYDTSAHLGIQAESQVAYDHSSYAIGIYGCKTLTLDSCSLSIDVNGTARLNYGIFISNTSSAVVAIKNKAQVNLSSKGTAGTNHTISFNGGGTLNVDNTSTVIMDTDDAAAYNGTYTPATGSVMLIDTNYDGILEAYLEKPYNVSYSHVEIHPAIKVTLDLSGANASNQKLYWAKGVSFPEPSVPSVKGYVFAGWYTSSSYTTAFNFNQARYGDTTIYAKFIEDPYKAIDAAKTELQGKIDAVSSALAGKADAATLATAVADLANAKTNIETLLNKIDDYADADAALKTELKGYIDDADTTIKNSITELTARVTEIEDKLNTANGKINTNTTDIGTLETDVDTLKTWENDAQTAIEALQALTATQGINISALQTAIADLQAAVNTANSNITAAENRIAALEGKVSALETAKTNLENAVSALQTAVAGKADAATVNAAIAELQTAIDALEAVKDDYVTADATLKAELAGKIATAKSEAISAAETLVNNAKAELQSKIDAKADAATTTVAIQNLQAAVAALESVKDDYATADAALKTELESKISAAQTAAISAAETLVNNTKAELTAAINNKADTATLNAKINELNTAIATAEATAKAYTDGAAAALTTAIATAKSEAISAAETLVNNAKSELQSAIDTKADAATVNAAIANLQNAITALQNAKDNYVSADAALKAVLEAAIAKAKQEAIDAAKGHIPYIGTNGNWWIGDTDTGVDANGIKGDTGNGIASITTKKENGVTTVTITFTDTTKQPVVFTISDGNKGDTGADGVGIAKIEKTAADGNVDTYTITLTNGKTFTFTVTNGKDGANGKDGLTPFIGENGNWWIGETDTGVKAAADDSIPVGSGNVTEAEGVNTVTVVAIVIASLALLGNVLLAVLVLKKKKSLV